VAQEKKGIKFHRWNKKTSTWGRLKTGVKKAPADGWGTSLEKNAQKTMRGKKKVKWVAKRVAQGTRYGRGGGQKRKRTDLEGSKG